MGMSSELRFKRDYGKNGKILTFRFCRFSVCSAIFLIVCCVVHFRPTHTSHQHPFLQF